MRFPTRALLAALAAALALAACAAPMAGAASLQPRGDKIFFGISDTGDSADFGAFSKLLDKHPAVIESFRTWGSDFPESIERWQAARARPMLHITTADNSDGHELISPRAIAQGYGDEYLIRLNKLFWARGCAPTSGRWASPTAASTSTPPTTAPALPRRGAQPALVQTRLPPHLHPRPRRRQAGQINARLGTPACGR